MPDTLDDLRDYRREMLDGDVLHVSDWARSRAREIVLEPPVPFMARPLLETVNFITVVAAARPSPPRVRLLAAAAGGAAQGAAWRAGRST